MIKHFGRPPPADATAPPLGPRMSTIETNEQLLVRMKRLETQQIHTLSEPLIPSAPTAQTSFSNPEYSAQPSYAAALPSIA